MHCGEVHSSLAGSRIFSIANGYKYCTTLLKTACRLQSRQQGEKPVSPPDAMSARPTDSSSSRQKVEKLESSGKDSSKPIPIRRRRPSKRESTNSRGSLVGSKSFQASRTPHSEASVGSWSLVDSVSGSSSLQDWVVISMSDSELSGYEADVERGTTFWSEVGESCDELEESQLLQSLTSYLVPAEVQQKLWLLAPLYQCIELLRESMKGNVTVNW